MRKESDPEANVPNQVLRIRALASKRFQPLKVGVDLRLTGRLYLQLEDALHRFLKEEQPYYKHTEVIHSARALLRRIRQLIKHSHLFQVRDREIGVMPGSVEIVIEHKHARAGLKVCSEIRDIGWIRGDMIDELIRRFKTLNVACHRNEDTKAAKV